MILTRIYYFLRHYVFKLFLVKLKSQGLCGEGLKDNTLSNHPYAFFLLLFTTAIMKIGVGTGRLKEEIKQRDKSSSQWELKEF